MPSDIFPDQNLLGGTGTGMSHTEMSCSGVKMFEIYRVIANVAIFMEFVCCIGHPLSESCKCKLFEICTNLLQSKRIYCLQCRLSSINSLTCARLA